MTCMWAGEHLSAYLDDALDPHTRQGMQRHIETCDECQAILDDYQHFDELLVNMPRIEPSDALRDRIFDSPEYASVLRQLERERESSRPRMPQFLSPARARMLLPAAAMLLLALGTALLVKQGFPASQPVASQSTFTTIGNPGRTGSPLTAGPRLVYAHEGALWSAPEQGAGLAQQLTPAGVQVGGWSVSPSTGDTPGGLVAYIDARSGAIRLIRSDGQSDRVIGSVASAGTASLPSSFWGSPAGQAIAHGLVWSPDGTRIAYLASGTAVTSDASETHLHVMNADGTHDVAVRDDNHALTSPAVWSGDSLRVAYTQTGAGQTSVWNYAVTLDTVGELAAQADPTAPHATVTRLAWLADTLDARLTWMTQTGIFARSALDTQPAQRLTAQGERISAADFAASAQGGEWLVANGSSLDVIAARTGIVTHVATSGTAGAVAQRIVWSPTGDAAAVLAGDALSLWQPGQSLRALSSQVRGDVAPAWTVDGHRLAYATSAGVVAMRVGAGGQAPGVLLASADLADTSVLAWAPDGQSLAITTASGVTLAGGDTGTRQVDAQAPADGVLVWSLAG